MARASRIYLLVSYDDGMKILSPFTVKFVYKDGGKLLHSLDLKYIMENNK